MFLDLGMARIDLEETGHSDSSEDFLPQCKFFGQRDKMMPGML